MGERQHHRRQCPCRNPFRRVISTVGARSSTRRHTDATLVASIPAGRRPACRRCTSTRSVGRSPATLDQPPCRFAPGQAGLCVAVAGKDDGDGLVAGVGVGVAGARWLDPQSRRPWWSRRSLACGLAAPFKFQHRGLQRGLGSGSPRRHQVAVGLGGAEAHRKPPARNPPSRRGLHAEERLAGREVARHGAGAVAVRDGRLPLAGHTEHDLWWGVWAWGWLGHGSVQWSPSTAPRLCHNRGPPLLQR